MAADIKLKKGSLDTVIDDGATLADGVRSAGDYDNSVNLHPFCHAYLTVQWDGTAPSVNAKVAELYVLPGDGEGTEVFPEGGDAGLGTDVTPQKTLLVGSFETRRPSITVDEVLVIRDIPLSFEGNRFVLMNTSGQTFDATWQLHLKTYLVQTV